jgi:hypothetical protein
MVFMEETFREKKTFVAGEGPVQLGASD